MTPAPAGLVREVRCESLVVERGQVTATIALYGEGGRLVGRSVSTGFPAAIEDEALRFAELIEKEFVKTLAPTTVPEDVQWFPTAIGDREPEPDR